MRILTICIYFIYASVALGSEDRPYQGVTSVSAPAETANPGEPVYGPQPLVAVPTLSISQQDDFYRAVSDELIEEYGVRRLALQETEGEPLVMMDIEVDDLAGLLDDEVQSTTFRLKMKLDGFTEMCVGSASRDLGEFQIQGLYCTPRTSSDLRTTSVVGYSITGFMSQRGFGNYGGVQDSICSGGGVGIFMTDPDALRNVRGGRLPIRGFFQPSAHISGCGGYSFLGKSEGQTVRAGQIDLRLPFGIITDSPKTRTQLDFGVDTSLKGQYSDQNLYAGSGVRFDAGFRAGIYRGFGKNVALQDEKQAEIDPKRRRKRSFFALNAFLNGGALVQKFPDQQIDHEATLIMGGQMGTGIAAQLFLQNQKVRASTEARVQTNALGLKQIGRIVDLRASQVISSRIRNRQAIFHFFIQYNLGVYFAPGTHYPTYIHVPMMGIGFGRHLK